MGTLRMPLAEGASPSSGMDKLGPMAVMKSISKRPTEKILGGVLLNQKLSPTILVSQDKKTSLPECCTASLMI